MPVDRTQAPNCIYRPSLTAHYTTNYFWGMDFAFITGFLTISLFSSLSKLDTWSILRVVSHLARPLRYVFSLALYDETSKAMPWIWSNDFVFRNQNGLSGIMTVRFICWTFLKTGHNPIYQQLVDHLLLAAGPGLHLTPPTMSSFGLLLKIPGKLEAWITPIELPKSNSIEK